MKIGIVGNGFVGQATRVLQCPEIEILTWDILPEKCDPPGLQLSDLNECEFIFVAVPTPMNRDGSCCLRIVESAIKSVQEVIDPTKTRIILRSTVPVGTSSRLNCFFMPEFLTEKNWRQDFAQNPDWFFGLPSDEDPVWKEKIQNLFTIAKKNGCIQSDRVTFVSPEEAEAIKYFRNVFLSVKVSFCNEFERFCTACQVDYETVRRLATLDSRIGASHTAVPGHDGRRGFGGTCFPKDTHSLLTQFKDAGIEAPVLEAVVHRNETIDRPEHDWCQDLGRAFVPE